MEFGRCENIGAADLALPPDEARSSAVLQGGGRGLRVRVGAPTWKNADWIGSLYPAKTRQADLLVAYAEQLEAIELNSSFYAIPRASTVDGWASQTPPTFRFCPKVPRTITREHKLAGRGALDDARRFCDVFERLGDRLGMAFMQLPANFGPDEHERLAAFLQQWPSHIPLAVEFRETGWFSKRRLLGRGFQALQAAGMTTVITDTLGRRDVSHASLPAPRVLVRFVGEAHSTDTVRLEAWAERIAAWEAAGLEELYFFIHQHDDGLAPPLIAQFVEALRKHVRADVRRVLLHEAPLFA